MKLKLIFIAGLLFSSLNATDTNPATIQTDKGTYGTEDKIVVTVSNMLGDAHDWVAIYKADSSTAWENVLRWDWTDGITDGNFTFDELPEGEYEAKAFFEDSYIVEARATFKVEDVPVEPTVALTLSKSKYLPNESISVAFEHMLGDSEDWIAIYPKDSTTAWKNVIEWDFTKGSKSGAMTFETLPIGEYEIRAFFQNSFKLEQSKAFEVVALPVISTMYEDAEDGLSNEWIHHVGNYAPIRVTNGVENNGVLALATEWTQNGTVNVAEYYLPLNNTTQKILEMDIGGVANYLLPNKVEGQEGYMSHFAIGVTIHTQNGKRKMLWDSFLNHENIEAYRIDYGAGNIWMYFPSPVEHVRGYLNVDIHQWDHFRVDVESALKEFEPSNEVISIDFLLLTGGFVDNIKLSSK
jgi:hypothetical protein